MGDENSLAGTTKAHKHTSPASDGGFLQTTDTGVTNMSEGSVGYYNSSSVLQELSLGSASDQIRVNAGATAPEYFTPSGGGATLTRQYVTTLTEFTTDSTSYIDVTSMTVTLQAGTGNCFLTFNSFYQQSGSSGFWRWECSTDGTQQESKITDQSSSKLSICLPYVTNTLGAQTCKIQSKNDNGNTNYFASDAEGPSTICALEIS